MHKQKDRLRLGRTVGSPAEQLGWLFQLHKVSLQHSPENCINSQLLSASVKNLMLLDRYSHFHFPLPLKKKKEGKRTEFRFQQYLRVNFSVVTVPGNRINIGPEIIAVC